MLEQVCAPPDELGKQFIPNELSWHAFNRFDDFLRERHQRLAAAMNPKLREPGLFMNLRVEGKVGG